MIAARQQRKKHQAVTIQIMLLSDVLSVVDPNMIFDVGTALFVLFYQGSAPKHERVAVVRPHSIDDTESLHPGTFGLSFSRRLMVRDLQWVQELPCGPLELIVQFAASGFSALSRSSQAIIHEDELDVESQ